MVGTVLTAEEHKELDVMEEIRSKQGKSFKQRKENKEDDGDLVSGLPDSILLHILSFLTMEDAIRTSLLSRRWRSLWKSIWNMDFGDPRLRSVKDIVSFVDKIIALHEDSKIRQFHISFEYEEDYALRVDSWVDYVVKHNVEQFHLDCVSGEFVDADVTDCDPYELPSCLFHCGSLEALTLKHCDLNLPSSMSLSALKFLTLVQLELGSNMVKDLTSSCPHLEELTIVDCNRRSALNIFAVNRKLRRLRIIDYYNAGKAGTQVEIYAPNLLCLELQGATLRINYLVKDLSALVEVNIHLEEMLTNDSVICGDHYDNILKKLLDNLRHAKHLKLCSWCIQVLFVRELQRQDSVSINATCLELRLGLSKWELPGIAHLLRGSCNIDTLIISKDSKEDNCALAGVEDLYDYDERGYWGSLELSFSHPLRHLKTIQIFNFLGGDWIYPLENASLGVDGFLKYHNNDLELVKVLLNNSRVLERMTISISKDVYFRKWAEKAKLLPKLAQKLLRFPRASVNAEIVLS